MPACRLGSAALLTGAALAALASPVRANPGGGASGSSPPSATAPDFDAAAEYRKGVDALKADRFAEARKAFQRVLSVAPGDANANFLAGMADAGLKDLRSARKHYERAVKANGKLVAARQELAVTYAKLGDRDKAESELAKLRSMATACAGSCPDADSLNKAILAVQKAIADGRQAALETRPPLLFASAAAGDGAYLAAVALINERRFAEAIDALERAKASFGAHPDVLTYLGFANRKLGRFAIAESYYRQALAAAPEHKGATEYYGELMIERGDLRGARAMLRKLDAMCSFGCAEADELRRWVEAGRSPES